ncbi:type III secretion system chaperone family protein [Modestobacter lapidis]|nr:YbjN domain-containing protein [Modestobacter lapidis]
MSERTVTALAAVVDSTLRAAELEYEQTAPGRFVVTLPGTKKLKTVVGLIVGDHGFRIEAFVCRQPDENREQLWAWLLQHNARMYGLSYSIDSVGDVYLTGRLGHSAITPEEIDTLLGTVLAYADEHFNTLLEIGFGSSIKREWAWRVKRGESLANLQAFAAFADPERTTAHGEEPAP